MGRIAKDLVVRVSAVWQQSHVASLVLVMRRSESQHQEMISRILLRLIEVFFLHGIEYLHDDQCPSIRTSQLPGNLRRDLALISRSMQSTTCNHQWERAGRPLPHPSLAVAFRCKPPPIQSAMPFPLLSCTTSFNKLVTSDPRPYRRVKLTLATLLYFLSSLEVKSKLSFLWSYYSF